MWKDVERVFAEAFERLGDALAADLPSIVAMIIVVLATVVVAAAVRWLLR